MNAAPSFQYYPKDVLSSADIAALTLEEFGALQLLECYDWTEVGLPKDPKKLAKLLRISERKMVKLWKNIAKLFHESGEKWTNPSLEMERERQAVRRLHLSENGKKGGRPPKADAFSEQSQRLFDGKAEKSLASATASSSASATAILTTSCSEPQAASEPEVIVLTFPCIGSNDKTTYGVTQPQVTKWQETYTAIDVLAELRRAAMWTDANPERRKTHKGVPRFLIAWLGKAHDRGGSHIPLGSTNKPHWQLSPSEKAKRLDDALVASDRILEQRLGSLA
jgi:uncharacterized protein YdaU (DUF1376 family)